MITEYVRGRVFNYSHCLGGTAVAGKGFFYPSDFALGSNGAFYVVQKAIEFNPSAGVAKFTLDSDDGLLWESRGLDFLVNRGPLPSAVGVDSDENVYVADEFMNQIWVFDVNGNPLTNWGRGPSESGDRASKKTLVYRSPFSRILQHQYSTKEGVPFDLYLKKVQARDTSADGDLNGPMGLRFDNDDNLFISDSYNHRVQVFAKDGTFLRKFGEFGDGDGQLNLPWGLDLDSEGCVYVADWRNRRVQKFSPEGDYMATIGGPGSGEGELERPSSVAIDKDGDVYVTDWGANRLKIYESDGTHILTLAGDADELPPWQQERVDENIDTKRSRMRADLSTEKIFKRPITVRVDDEGRIMVLEAVGNRLQVYVKEQDWIEPPFNQ